MHFKLDNIRSWRRAQFGILLQYARIKALCKMKISHQ